MRTIRLIGTVWLLISLCWVSTTWAQSQGLITIRVNPNSAKGLVLGNGYRLSQRQAGLIPCVSFPQKTQNVQDGAEYVSEFSFVKSRNEVADAKSMSASAKASASFAGIGASV